MKIKSNKNAAMESSENLGVKKTPDMKASKKRKSIQTTPNTNSNVDVHHKNGNMSGNKTPKGKPNNAAINSLSPTKNSPKMKEKNLNETPVNASLLNVKKSATPKQASNVAQSQNKVDSASKVGRNRNRKRKRSVKIDKEQIETENTKPSATKKEKASEVPAKKVKHEETNQPPPKIEVVSRHFIVHFPASTTSFKPAMVNLLGLCDEVCLPSQLNFSFNNLQEQTKRIADLKNITAEGKKVHVLIENDPLRRIIKINNPSQDTEEIKLKFGAESIEKLSLRRNSKFYLLTFESEEKAQKADKENVTIQGKSFTVQKYSISKKERAEMYASDFKQKNMKSHLVAVHFPAGTSNHKSALLQILKMSDDIGCPFRMYLTYKSLKEAQKNVPLLQNITVEGKNLKVKQRFSDPLRRVVYIAEDKTIYKESIQKKFLALSIEPVNSKGKRQTLYLLTFKNESLAQKSDKKTVIVDDTEFTVREYFIFGNKDNEKVPSNKKADENLVKSAEESGDEKEDSEEVEEDDEGQEVEEGCDEEDSDEEDDDAEDDAEDDDAEDDDAEDDDEEDNDVVDDDEGDDDGGDDDDE